jgi:hypothetical protein
MTTCYLMYRADNNTHAIVSGENPYRNAPTLTSEQVKTVFGPVPSSLSERQSLSDYQYDSAETAVAAHAAMLGDSTLVR